MKKPQFLKFCEALASSTSVKETISAFENKKGYGSKRTLERCVQAAEGFKENLQSEVIASKTGWSVRYIDKIHTWWTELVTQKSREPYKETVHKKEMRELAGELRDKIGLPPLGSYFFLEFGPGRLVSGSTIILINQDGKVSVDLDIDEEGLGGHLWKGLRCHLETGGFAEVLGEVSEWKSALAQYVEKCHQLMKAATRKVVKEGWHPDEKTERNNEKPGYKVDFFTSACADAIEVANRKPPVTDSGEIGRNYYCERLTNNLWLLIRYGFGGIYIAKTELEARRYQHKHRALVSTLSSEPLAGEIAKLRGELEQMVKEIKQQLQKFIDMERVPGHCELCE